MRALWWRWVGRDLRQRWLLIGAIALVLALGTGSYAALAGTGTWRTQSNDASFALLALHDVEVALTPGSVVPEGTLTGVADGLPGAGSVTTAEERLILPTQVAARTPAGEDVLVAGRIVGSDAVDVDLVHVESGRALAPDDPVPTVVLEQKFAAAHQLPSSGEVVLRGSEAVRYVGVGMGPEDFIIDPGGVGFFTADSAFATIYTTLAGAQAIAETPGAVNDLVLRVDTPDDVAAIVDELTVALADADPPISASVTTRDDEMSYRMLYEDIDNDAQFWTVVSLLMVAGATLAAVNLISRVMEGQRREIGIGMALGVRRRRLAVRPFVLAGAIAVSGVALGLAVGAALVVPLRGVYSSMLPLPIWETPLVLGPFLVAAAVGVLVPVLATVWPVHRALRVEPVEAIRVGHLAATGAGWSGLLAAVPMPGRSLAQIPARNVLRTPRRTLLTSLGIAAALSVLVAIGGILDSLQATLDRAEVESVGDAPDRLEITLERIYPASGGPIAAIAAADGVDTVTPTLELPATASPATVSGQPGAGSPGSAERAESEPVDLVVEVLDVRTAPWAPTVSDGEGVGGLLLSEVAAADLGVEPGDRVRLEHPRLTTQGLAPDESLVTVAGTHPHPLRPLAYLDPDSAAILGSTQFANVATVVPDGTTDSAELRTTVATVPGVATVARPRDIIDELTDVLDQIVGILGVVALVTVVLAGLIAVNSARIAAEERRREHATMLAFGLSHRTVLRLSMAEGALIGLVGTAIGLAFGALLIRLMVYVQLPQTLPDIGMTAAMGWRTILAALALGVAAVALAPLINARQLKRMDVPGTLRLVE